MDPKKPSVTFTPPRVDPAVTDPVARAYAQQIAERRGPAALPTYSAPVGGPPMPHIPPLDSQHLDGQTMAQQAPQSYQQPQQPAGGIFGQAPPQVAPVGVSPASFGILPADMLPEEARQDPAYRDGQGAMFASAQPNLAVKYGVMRNGQKITPQQLRPGPRRSPDETMADMKKAMEFERARQATESGDTSVEAESARGTGGAAARAASGGSDVKPLDAEQKEKLEVAKRALSNMDEFDFEAFRQAMMKDLLNNDEQKKIIEERLEPMALEDILMKNAVLQKVPIIPGKFEPTFHSLSGEDDLCLKRLIMQDSKTIGEVSERYTLDKFSLMSIAAMTHAINTHLYPEIHDKDGNFDDDLFWKRFNMVFKLPYHMLASLGINAFWFDVRVRKLFVAERLKNG